MDKKQGTDQTNQGRRPSNVYEAEFFDLAASHGWLLTTRGWPDFFLERDGQVICVEVKPSISREIRAPKRRVIDALVAAGIRCFAWSPEGGFERLFSGGKGVAVCSSKEPLVVSDGMEGSGGEGKLFTAPAEAPEAATSLPSQSGDMSDIDRVWAAYVAIMKPRKTAAGEGERVIIRAALKEASVEELVTCIQACEASDYHMKRGRHLNRAGGKYNAIGKILKPRPRLGETQRSRVDWWLERSESSGVAGFPSADNAIVAQRQIEVQRGYGSGDPEMVKKADEAEAWLSEHGIETVRRDDGYPTFRPKGKGGTQ